MTPKRRAVVTSFLAIVTIATVAIAVQRIRAYWPGLEKIVAQAAEVVQPAPLSAMHQNIPELSECRACHATASSIADEKCLKCHSEIGERRETKQGFHGNGLVGACAQCHKDHGEGLITFDRASFNHRQTTFPLVERHAELKCEQCHEKPVSDSRHEGMRFDFIGLKHDSCVACHDDPHHGDLVAKASGEGAASDIAKDRSCSSCHDQTGWTGRHMSFSHEADSSFKLRGAHASLDCKKCHEPTDAKASLASAPFKSLSTDCQSCHADPHRGTLLTNGKSCTSCHDQDSWTGRDLSFDHSRDTTFKLRGKHASLECTACHSPSAPGAALATADFKNTATGCASCHQDPHAGQFESPTTNCADCHQENGFKGSDLLFRHESVKSFPLTGAHASVACAACHKPTDASKNSALGARFRGLDTSCASCHEDPHAGSLAPKSCTTCHDTVAWTGPHLVFDHRSKVTSDFTLDAAHSTLSCASCHSSVVFKPTPTDCAKCHATEAAHLDGRVEIAGEAAQWTPSPHAGILKCTDCHDTTAPNEHIEDIATRCAKCHTQHYATLLLEQRAHLGSIVGAAREKLSQGASPTDETAAKRRAILDAALKVSAHDYLPAEQQARAVLESLSDSKDQPPGSKSGGG